LRHYIDPSPRVREIADEPVLDGCAHLQYFSLRLLAVCLREFAEVRERSHELILPEDIVKVVRRPGTNDRVVAAGLKAMAGLCETETMRLLFQQLDMPAVVHQVLGFGAYSSRVNCWRFAKVWMANASFGASAFLFNLEVLQSAIEQVQPDTLALSHAVIDFLIEVINRAIQTREFEIVQVVGTEEFVSVLSEIGDANPKSQIGDRAFALVRMLGEAETAERYAILSPQ
jgi:hypothetical protein